LKWHFAPPTLQVRARGGFRMMAERKPRIQEPCFSPLGNAWCAITAALACVGELGDACYD
jgi:hypothetical protein